MCTCDFSAGDKVAGAWRQPLIPRQLLKLDKKCNMFTVGCNAIRLTYVGLTLEFNSIPGYLGSC